MVALVGDAELDEGNVFEALLEGWKHGLRNTWWVVDYNRQGLDAVLREGLYERFADIFRTMGWDVVVVKYGSLQQAAFAEPGGDKLRGWIDRCPNQEYSALVFQGGAAWRKRLLDDLGDQGDVTRLIEARSDDDLAALMNNLGGHDLPALLEAFNAIDHDRPVCFLCYTVKGFGLPMAGHKDNHAGLMTTAQVDTLREALDIRTGHEWDKFEGLAQERGGDRGLSRRRAVCRQGDAGGSKPSGSRCPTALPTPGKESLSTQAGFGLILNEIGRSDSRSRPAHRHRVAGRHRLDQSRPVAQPAGALRQVGDGRRLQARAHPLDLRLGGVARGPAYRTRHRRDEPLPAALGARPFAFAVRRAAAADRNALRSLHRPRPRCAELRLLPGRPLHRRRHAFGRDAGAGGRRAPVDRHAADRHRPGRPGGFRAGLRRRTGGDRRLGLRLSPARRRRGP